MGLIQDPHFWSGLKSMGRAFFIKCRHMGSGINVVNIMTYLVFSPALLASIFSPLYAEAGVFSVISNLFSSSEVRAEEVEPNSQTLSLLQSTNSPMKKATTTKSELVIVSGTSLQSDTDELPFVAKTASDETISIYVVHEGDTLSDIAKMFNVSVNTIKWGNDLKGNSLTPGQTLVILPISGVQHVVKKGDTLQSIAKQHKGDLDEILSYNNLTLSSKLTVGDVITVPDGEVTATVITKPSSGGGKTSSNPTYAGYYLRPIVGGVKTQGVHGHNGVDLASAYGTNILAAAAGEVIISRNSGYNGGYGSYVVIKHANGTQTLYAHLSATTVNAGDFVSQGQVIGKMGSTGKSTGTHLHFEIRGARNPF